MGVERRLDGAEDLGRGLDELRLLGIAGLELVENFSACSSCFLQLMEKKGVVRGASYAASFIEYG